MSLKNKIVLLQVLIAVLVLSTIMVVLTTGQNSPALGSGKVVEAGQDKDEIIYGTLDEFDSSRQSSPSSSVNR